MKKIKKLLAVTALAALAGAAIQPASADEPRPYGPGTMGGYGPGMMGGYGPGQGAYGPGPGYGPGMMGGYGYGYGMGPGMMGGYGYRHGPDMMGGYGAGMMGGWGPGSSLGLGPLYGLKLNDQQLAKINQIRDESRRKNWEIVGKLMDENARMRDLLTADKRDPSAIGKQSMKIAELRRQLLEATVDAHNRVEALLSKEQKDELRNFRRGWMMDNDN